jgi:predicted NACHT family NTPase
MNNYIVQNMIKYLNLEHFSQIFNNDYTSYFDEKKTEPNFEELYNSKYLMLVAEPGYGKTRLFKELVLKADKNSYKVFFIDAKQIKTSIKESTEKCKVIESNISEEKLQKKIYFSNKEDYSLNEKTIICIDALDELPFSNLYSFFEQVEEFISENPSVKVFLSCRTHHLNKIDYDLSNISFEYLTLDKFYGKQVFDYLKNKDINKETIEKIKEKTKLGNLFDFLSIPRFLYYFSELIQNKNIEEIINLSRS